MVQRWLRHRLGPYGSSITPLEVAEGTHGCSDTMFSCMFREWRPSYDLALILSVAAASGMSHT